MQPYNVKVFVISSRRPKNVAKFPAHYAWVVKDEQDLREYKAEGAEQITVGHTFMNQRNIPLEYGEKNNAIVVEMDDDYKAFHVKTGFDQKDKKEISIHEAVEYMVGELAVSPFYLAGASTTGNPFYSDWKVPRKRYAFILASFIAVKPTHLRFDENLSLKEDYDYTLQHIKEYKGVLRLEHLLPTFAHRTNSGGVVDYRTAEREQENIAYLEKKWGTKVIRRRPAKPNEILLNFPRSR